VSHLSHASGTDKWRAALGRTGRGHLCLRVSCWSAGLSFLSLADTEGAEDQIEDVVVGGGAGDLVQGPEGIVEIKQ
jgi:hypothetical protein